MQQIEPDDFHIGNYVEVRFVNLQQKTNDVLDEMEMSHLFVGKTCTT
jgi:hypothetical protein